MPGIPQNIRDTNSKDETFQYSHKRLSGLLLKLPTGVTEITHRRIVTVQQSSNGVQYAVPGGLPFVEKVASGTTAAVNMKIIGAGVLDIALQSAGIDSIAPKPEVLKDGDRVVVLCDPTATYMVDYLSTAKPAEGSGDITNSTGSICRVDNRGRLVSTASTTAAPLGEVFGSVFSSSPGQQLSNQLKENAMFYRLFSNTQI